MYHSNMYRYYCGNRESTIFIKFLPLPGGINSGLRSAILLLQCWRTWIWWSWEALGCIPTPLPESMEALWFIIQWGYLGRDGSTYSMHAKYNCKNYFLNLMLGARWSVSQDLSCSIWDLNLLHWNKRVLATTQRSPGALSPYRLRWTA